MTAAQLVWGSAGAVYAGASAAAPTFTHVTLPAPGAAEPGIVIDADDRVFVNGASLHPQAPLTWASTDHGATFHTIGQFGVPMNPYFDTDIAIAPDDGTVYWVGDAAAGFSAVVYTSHDGGSSWFGPGYGGSAADRPWLAAAPNGVVYLLVHNLLSSVTAVLLKSTDHGLTFLPVSGFRLGEGNSATPGRFLVNPADPNDLVIFYTASSANGNPDNGPAATTADEVWIARSHDGGTTFENHRSFGGASVGHVFAGGAMDASGNLYAVFSRSATDTTTHVELVASHDGVTWTQPITVDGLADHPSNVFPSVTAGGGHVDVAWYTSTAAFYDDTTADWTVAFGRTTDSFSSLPSFTQVQVSPGVVHHGALCVEGSSCQSRGDNSGEFLDFLSVTSGPGGRASVVYNEDGVVESAIFMSPVPKTVYAREVAS
jgi:hypothetical protein